MVLLVRETSSGIKELTEPICQSLFFNPVRPIYVFLRTYIFCRIIANQMSDNMRTRTEFKLKHGHENSFAFFRALARNASCLITSLLRWRMRSRNSWCSFTVVWTKLQKIHELCEYFTQHYVLNCDSVMQNTTTGNFNSFPLLDTFCLLIEHFILTQREVSSNIPTQRISPWL